MTDITNHTSGCSSYEAGPYESPFIPNSGWDSIVGLIIYRAGIWRILFYIFVGLSVILSLFMVQQTRRPPLTVYAVTLDAKGQIIQKGVLPAPTGRNAKWVHHMRQHARDVSLWKINLPPPQQTSTNKQEK